jgi:hypothetical protein
MARKVVVFLIIILAALTLDFLRQEVFAWMDPCGDQKATSQNSGGLASISSASGRTSGTLSPAIGAYPPPDQPGLILYLPLVSKPAGQ